MGKNLYPEISICIPAYNQTTYLQVLLESIAAQTFTDYEIIVSDDSSTAEVKKLVDSFHFGDKLKYFKNDPALGSPSNWNAAIKRASGEYIKIMHHDDAFNDVNALQNMISRMAENNYDYLFCYSAVKNVQDAGKNRIHKIRNFDKLKRKPYLLFFGNSLGGPSSLMIRSHSLKHLEYDTQLIWLVDIEYYSRLLNSDCIGNIIEQPLILTHDASEQQLTSSILRNAELQVKEHAMLYNSMATRAPWINLFFMQVYLTRLLFKLHVKNNEVMNFFTPPPEALRIYFALQTIKPLYFAYRIIILALDIGRKFLS